MVVDMDTVAERPASPDCSPGEKVGYTPDVPIPACPRFSADSTSASTSGVSGSTGGGNCRHAVPQLEQRIALPSAPIWAPSKM